MNSWIAFILPVALTLSAGEGPRRHIRATGTIRAVHTVMIQVPRIAGQGGNMTLTRLIPNGSAVHPGDLLAEFDRTNELKLLREAEAKYDDLRHQVEQKAAEHKNTAEKRVADLKQADADLRKAQIELKKSPILSEIEQQKHVVEVEDAQQHVASLERSNHAHDTAEEAEVRILELQRDRQQVSVDRQRTNLDKLSLKAPIGGMVALANTFRNQSMGHAQEGDQLWTGSPLLQLFDPSEMEVQLSIGEPDGAVLVPGARAIVHLDAFPDLRFTARFESASPIATSSMGNSVKTFTAVFRLDQSDRHFMPDLSVALDIEAAP